MCATLEPFNNRSSQGVLQVISELPTWTRPSSWSSKLKALFLLFSTFPGSMVFIVSATSCEFWCILAVLNGYTGQDDGGPFEGFGVKTTGRDWFWMVLVWHEQPQNHPSNLKRFVETHGVKVLVYWSTGYVPILRGMPYFLGGGIRVP